MTKKNLQIITFILAMVPTITGIIGLLGIYDPIYNSIPLANNTLLDSNLRFLSGVWLGIGITAFSIIKKIDTETKLFQTLWLCIFLGGIGRLLSMFVIGFPPIPFIAFTILEILGAPFFIFWQRKIQILPR